MPTNVKDVILRCVGNCVNDYQQVSGILSSSVQLFAPSHPSNFWHNIPCVAALGLGDWPQVRTLAHSQTGYKCSLLPATATRVIVIGDLHGDWVAFLAVLNFLDANDIFTDPNCYIVFLGDYIDRGAASLTVLLGVLTLKAKFPDKVILLRGNHEDVWVCSRYGFTAELEQKFGIANGSSVLDLADAVFQSMPIHALTSTGVLFVHGGPYYCVPPTRICDLLSASNTHMEIKGVGSIIPALWVDPVFLRNTQFVLKRNMHPKDGTQTTACFLQPLRENLGITKVIRAHEISNIPTTRNFQSDVITVFSTGGSSDTAYPPYRVSCSQPHIVEVGLACHGVYFHAL